VFRLQQAFDDAASYPPFKSAFLETDRQPACLLLAFLCLGARSDELSAQTLDELEGIIKHITPVVERPRYNSSASEKKIVVFTGFCFKCSRNSFLVIASPKSSLQFSLPQHVVAGTGLNSRSFGFGLAQAPVSVSLTKRASSKVDAPLQHEHGIRV
jgi:hypothetical protein